ncbi:MAG: hypothetical protein ABIF10_04035 [Candidatus Woesearchaeota archaeon]
MKISLDKISTKGKSLMLAYDQGLEHGPTDFNDRNADPAYIMQIAKEGRYNAVILQKGIAEKYYDGSVPLVIKLNGKTSYLKGDPVSPLVCSVQEAINLGASAVGYTIYAGSIHECKMFEDFSEIQEKAHRKGLPVIAWMYPRGAAIRNENSRETLAYAARVGLELGADILKMKYNSRIEDLKWQLKSAGKAKMMIAGGAKTTEKKFLQEAYDVISCGCYGIAVGRNIWQHKEPLRITRALKKIIFENSAAETAIKEL